MKNEVTLNIEKFRLDYPAFKDVEKFTDNVITRCFNMSEIFVKNRTNCLIDLKHLETILYLMTAHLLQLETNTLNGQTAGVVTSATIDKITVSIAEPKNATAFSYWLNQTPYGMQLLALLKLLAMGGFSIGGYPETLAVRKVGGLY